MTEHSTVLKKENVGAWVVHHGQKTSASIGGAAEFPALDAAAKAASILSQLASTDQLVVDHHRVEALAKAAGLNPKTELPALLQMLSKRRLIEKGMTGDVTILGLTGRATTQHAADIFEDQEPNEEERASITLSEALSEAPRPLDRAIQYVSDTHHLTNSKSRDFIERAEQLGLIDAEGHGSDKILFNGHIFRRDAVVKTNKILNSLSTTDAVKVAEINGILDRRGCLGVEEADRILGPALFTKLRAAGMYDINVVSNPVGEFSFVTRPSAFHKFNDPFVDDAFDNAKALVAALAYGMTQSAAGRGRIVVIDALLKKLIRGEAVGPATAIGEDYRTLEMRGVIRVTRAGYGYRMKLLKRDVGQMALNVLTTGEAASSVVLDRPLPGAMTGYTGPEASRGALRRRQPAPSKRLTYDVLTALRTEGGF